MWLRGPGAERLGLRLGLGLWLAAAAAPLLLGPSTSWGLEGTPLPPSVGVRRVEELCNSGAMVRMRSDFGDLGRYRQANARLGPPGAGENRVVFFGDSITDLWRLESWFPGKRYLNRGIGGQTTSQMLVRFRQDVIELRPAVVVILAGTNDIAGNTGPIAMPDIQANLSSLVDLARANGIKAVMSSVTPVHNYTVASQRIFPDRPPEKISELNKWLKEACAARGLVYLDYFSAMIDAQGLLMRNLSEDGLHPNKMGYAIMSPLAARAIEAALRGPAAPPGR